MNLGYIAPVNNLIKIKSNNISQKKFITELFYCPKSSLVQLGTILDKKNYFSKRNIHTLVVQPKILRDNFKNLFLEIKNKFNFKKKELIVDIGSNDGNLWINLKNYFTVVGVTPEKIGKIAIKKGIPTLIRYFDKKSVDIICVNMEKHRLLLQLMFLRIWTISIM